MSDARPDRRGAVLAAAFDAFAQYGFGRTSMEQIARDAGMSRAAVYLHFPNKEAIFRELAEDLQRRALDAAGQAAALDAPVHERISGVLHAKLGMFFEVSRSPHARDLLDESNRLAGDITAQFRKRYLRLMRTVVEDAVTAGELRPAVAGLTASTAAELIVDCAYGVEAGPKSRTAAQYRRRVDQLVGVLVAGLGGMAT